MFVNLYKKNLQYYLIWGYKHRMLDWFIDGVSLWAIATYKIVEYTTYLCAPTSESGTGSFFLRVKDYASYILCRNELGA